MAEGSDKARTQGGLKSEFPASPPESGTIANANERADLVELDADGSGPDADFLAKELKRRVVGQDEAVEQVAAFYQQSQAGLSPPGRPVGSFLFLGPTGSGKTKTVEALAEVLAENQRAVIKIDCGEFQHSHEIAKLIGSPPGYLGHRETQPLLSQEVLNQYHTDKLKLSFVLFDEIEKASDSLWNLLLGILDKATLTLGDNRRVDFSRAMIFMTSNLGAEEMKNLVKKKIGFYQEAVSPEQLAQKMETSAVAAARKKFTPEFMNRIDKVIVFKPLGNDDLRNILDIELDYVQQRINMSGKQILVSVTNGAKDQILREAAPDIKYGARELKRVVEQQVTKKLGGLIAKNLLDREDAVTIDYKDGRFTFSKPQSWDLSAHNHLQAAPG
jgi:ATP-dependent Clp protease ATP-binding subunit ClpB